MKKIRNSSNSSLTVLILIMSGLIDAVIFGMVLVKFDFHDEAFSLAAKSDTVVAFIWARVSCRLILKRRLLQDDDHSGSCPHSFPGMWQVLSGMSLERIRSGLELAGSEKTRQAERKHLKCGSPSK